MYKKFVCILFLFFTTFVAFGCDRSPKTMILFNKYPINKANILNNATSFKLNTRIYYIFLTEKPIKYDTIRVRVLKEEEKTGYQTTRLVYSNDFKVHNDQIYYYDDYIVMNENGTYRMVIYNLYSLQKPLASAEFKVTD